MLLALLAIYNTRKTVITKIIASQYCSDEGFAGKAGTGKWGRETDVQNQQKRPRKEGVSWVAME